MFAARSVAGLNAVTETGTDWILSPVRRAVTMIASDAGESAAGAGVDAGAGTTSPGSAGAAGAAGAAAVGAATAGVAVSLSHRA